MIVDVLPTTSVIESPARQMKGGKVTRGQLAIGSGLLFILSIVGMFVAYGSTAFLFVFSGNDPAHVPALAIPPLHFAATAGLVGLLASGVWQLIAVGRQRANESHERPLALQIERMLAEGKPRTEIERVLKGNGVDEEQVQQALHLEWPHGDHCSRCGGEVRGFSYLREHLGRVWNSCPACGWVGPGEENNGRR